MAAPTRTPRTSWIEEGLRALGVGGPDAVRIEKLAQALGVTKGGFYWHFDDRRALLGEILDAWERMSVDDVIERVDRLKAEDQWRIPVLFEHDRCEERSLKAMCAARAHDPTEAAQGGAARRWFVVVWQPVEVALDCRRCAQARDEPPLAQREHATRQLETSRAKSRNR